MRKIQRSVAVSVTASYRSLARQKCFCFNFCFEIAHQLRKMRYYCSFVSPFFMPSAVVPVFPPFSLSSLFLILVRCKLYAPLQVIDLLCLICWRRLHHLPYIRASKVASFHDIKTLLAVSSKCFNCRGILDDFLREENMCKVVLVDYGQTILCSASIVFYFTSQVFLYIVRWFERFCCWNLCRKFNSALIQLTSGAGWWSAHRSQCARIITVLFFHSSNAQITLATHFFIRRLHHVNDGLIILTKNLKHSPPVYLSALGNFENFAVVHH